MAPPVKRTVRRVLPPKLQSIAKPEAEDKRSEEGRRVDQRRKAVRRTSPVARAAALQKVIPILSANARREGDDAADGTDYKGIMKKYNDKINNRKSAIRAYCVTCSNGSLAEVRWCSVKKCALWPFRLGADPFNLKSIKADAARRGESVDDADDDEVETTEEE